MALSANKDLNVRVETSATMIVKTSSVLYVGAFVTFDTTSGALKPYAGAIGDRAAGWMLGQVPAVVGSGVITGNSSATPPVLAAVAFGGDFTLENWPITGASAETDSGKPVYATDDGTYTLTDPTTHRFAVGYVGRYRSTGFADLVTSRMLGVLGS